VFTDRPGGEAPPTWRKKSRLRHHRPLRRPALERKELAVADVEEFAEGRHAKSAQQTVPADATPK
jgi:hypothetical protein